MNVFNDVLSLSPKDRNLSAKQDLIEVYGKEGNIALMNSNFGLRAYLGGHFAELDVNDYKHGYERLADIYNVKKPRSENRWLGFGIQIFRIYAVKCFGFTDDKVVYKALLEIFCDESNLNDFNISVVKVVKQAVKYEILTEE